MDIVIETIRAQIYFSKVLRQYIDINVINFAFGYGGKIKFNWFADSTLASCEGGK